MIPANDILKLIESDEDLNKVLRPLPSIGNEYYAMTSECGGYYELVIRAVKNGSSVEFIVWNPAYGEIPDEGNLSEVYLSGWVKWDGCSHFYFGDQDVSDEFETGRSDGYIHICGEPYFHQHRKLMFIIVELAMLVQGEQLIDESYSDISIEKLELEAKLLNNKIARLKLLNDGK